MHGLTKKTYLILTYFCLLTLHNALNHLSIEAFSISFQIAPTTRPRGSSPRPRPQVRSWPKAEPRSCNARLSVSPFNDFPPCCHFTKQNQGRKHELVIRYSHKDSSSAFSHMNSILSLWLHSLPRRLTELSCLWLLGVHNLKLLRRLLVKYPRLIFKEVAGLRQSRYELHIYIAPLSMS